MLNTQTKQFIEKVDDNSNMELIKEKLEDQLIFESTIVNQERLGRQSTKNLNFLPPSKLLGLSSMAVIAIGGSSL